MNGWTFREITNSLAVMYGVFLIVILLMIIAFRNHPAFRPRPRRSPRHA